MGYDAIIITSNEMDARGTLNEESASRACVAAKVAIDLEIPYVITCGWAYRKDSEITLADAFKRYLVENFAIEPNRILAVIESRDTVGEALFTRIKIVEPMGFRNLCVVTSGYHVPRVCRVFQFVYGANFNIKIIEAGGKDGSEVEERERASIVAFEKTFNGVQAGDLCKIIEAVRRRHPYYNGDIHPKISLLD